MASPPIAELTAQVVTLTDQVTTLSNRLSVAEQNQALNAAQTGSMRGGDAGVFDKKRLYPKELKESGSFRSWSERFLAWLEMDHEEIGIAFKHAGRQESALDTSGLTPLQASYSKAVYSHLRSLTEGFRAKPVKLSAL